MEAFHLRLFIEISRCLGLGYWSIFFYSLALRMLEERELLLIIFEYDSCLLNLSILAVYSYSILEYTIY